MPGQLPFYEGWQTLRIHAPNPIESSRESGELSIQCKP
jgi:hypothetical protein